MTEKYKIYLSEEMKSRLEDDAELFEFFKKDGSVNLNAFLKELLIHYFDPYRDQKTELLRSVLAELSSIQSVNAADAEAIASRLVNAYLKHGGAQPGKAAAVTLTVSGPSLDIMRSIENNLLTDSSLSQYISGLLASYLSISRSGREQILFGEICDRLDSAIRNHRIITFSSTTAPDLVFTVQPYMIAASREEQFNYLLCVDARYSLPRTFRISRLRALYTTSECFVPDEQVRERLQKIALRNPQSASGDVQAQVQLTDRGIQKFRMVTKNRPDVLRTDGNTYYFNWPPRQLEEYFKRFGQDAVIVSPKECRDNMKAFYRKGLDAYSASVSEK
ncbi:MAG: WYL domain-containing protein [Lachnospiraceae bacterium]|nr:WYL domain-containing protein [Lachnospiraceae bacterium]